MINRSKIIVITPVKHIDNFEEEVNKLGVVDIKENRKRASDILWNMKKDSDVVNESYRILKRHTLQDRNRMLRRD